MEARKTKNAILKLVLHYLFMAAIIAATVVSYLNRDAIAQFFSQDLTGMEIVDAVFLVVPTIITSLQIIVAAVVINFVVKMLSKLTFGMTDKVKTIANMLASLIKWIIIIVAILFILSAWGVDTTTLLAGAGIVALVIGLGAQSIIADVLAGIFIVLEGEYVVGDIVVIDGWRGKITSIGVRTTQLEDIGGNIKIVNNSEIKTVINKTKHQSVANCSINVTSEVPLVKVEEIILSALPQIRHSIPAITADIVYKGINTVSDITTEMLFTARCYEEDLYQVQRDLHRELKLLLDRNGIAPFAPPTYIIDDKDNRKDGPKPMAAHTAQPRPAMRPAEAQPQVRPTPQSQNQKVEMPAEAPSGEPSGAHE